MTPVLNTIIRTQEYEADVFGLNAARQPDGFAQAALMLSEYRKMEPGPLGGDHLLRPPERPHAHPHGDALEGGESGDVEPGRRAAAAPPPAVPPVK